jgi:hypothetical protein
MFLARVPSSGRFLGWVPSSGDFSAVPRLEMFLARVQQKKPCMDRARNAIARTAAQIRTGQAVYSILQKDEEEEKR